MTRSEPGNGLRTTEQSLDIADLVRRRGGATLQEVHSELGVAKSTAYQHLSTLERHGFLRKVGDTYRVGLRFLNFGEHVHNHHVGFGQAADAVEAVADRTGEEVDFFAETAGKVITVHVSYDASNPFRDQTVDASDNHWRRGTVYDIHSLAGGKAILSEKSEAWVREMAARHGLASNTEYTICDVETLLDELERIRERGYALSEEEYVEGLCAVACQVDAPDGSVLGALAVNVPTYRFDGALSTITEVLLAEVESLEETLAETAVK